MLTTADLIDILAINEEIRMQLRISDRSIALSVACENFHHHTDGRFACHGDHCLCPEGARLLEVASKIRDGQSDFHRSSPLEGRKSL